MPNTNLATKSLTDPTSPPEALPDSEDDEGSAFSDFSSDGSYSDPLSSEVKHAGLFSEHVFNIQTILGHLTRISTVIRRSGAKYRYRKADASLREEEYEDFRTELNVAILLGNLADSKIDSASLITRISDSNLLTSVQERLINANIVRRNRIKFATRPMKASEAPAAQTQKRSPSKIIQRPVVVAQSTTSPSQKRVSDTPIIQQQASSIKAPSVTQTATNVGSHLDWQQAVEPKKSTPSVITRITKTGADQDYPSCPKPTFGDLLQCPYCADFLPESYCKNASRWKYEPTPTYSEVS